MIQLRIYSTFPPFLNPFLRKKCLFLFRQNRKSVIKWNIIKMLIINYLICWFLYGAVFSNYGTIILFLADTTGLAQSSFTILFTMRGVGFILAGILKLKLLKDVDLHRGMAICAVGAGICSVMLLGNYNAWYLGVWSLLFNFFVCAMDIMLSVLTLRYKPDHGGFYMSMAYVFVSTGGGVGSYVISLLTLHSYYLFGVVYILCGVIYTMYPKFEQHSCEQKNQTNDPQLSPCAQINLALLYGFFGGFSLSFRSWFPTFCVISAYQTKEQATITVSFIAVVLLSSRLVFLNFRMTSWFLILITRMMVVFPVFILLQYFLGFQLILVYSSAVAHTILISQYSPYVFVFPSFYNKTLTSSNSSKIVAAYAIGQSVLTFFVGYLMDFTHPMALFLYLLFLAIIMNFILNNLVNELSQPDPSLSKQLIQLS